MANILIVDDDYTIRHIFARVARHLGHHPIEARHGQAALAQLATQSQPMDLILTDLQMPILNGMELITRIRIHPEWQYIPILIVTGTPPCLECQYILTYVDGILLKPFSVSVLSETITALIARG